MYRLNKQKPDIKVYRSGSINLLTSAVKKMGLNKDTCLSFFVDEDNNLYIRKEDAGLHLSCVKGRILRFNSVDTTNHILSLPDIPEGTEKAGFRIGESEDGINFPVITRRIL